MTAASRAFLVTFREGDNACESIPGLSAAVSSGRRIENLMLASVMRHARQTGVFRVTGEYQPTAKNGQVADPF